MRKLFAGVLAVSIIVISSLSVAACGDLTKSKSSVLGKPKAVTQLSNEERKAGSVRIISETAEKFAAEFAPIAYKDCKRESNFVVAPVSVYMALSLAAQCSVGNTRAEILSALGVTYEQLNGGFADYYRSLFNESKYNGKTTGLTAFSNSIWLDSNLNAKQDCVETLADNYYCYSYSADFNNDNKAANKAVREFVKDNTKGLIDKNFELSRDTLFALINTLYFKSIWNCFGDDLDFTDNEYDFINYNETTTNTKLLRGYYCGGKIYEDKAYKTFFTSTYGGNKIKFILPNDGYSVDDVFTCENIAKINSVTDYNAIDDANKIKYYTRCLFPEFSAVYDSDIKALLTKIGINDLFDNALCDYTALTEDGAYCSNVIHSAKLEVNKSGIEGAAVTVVENAPTSVGPEPDTYEKIYFDFILDKSFGFILTDSYDNTLFSGVIKII